MPKKHVVALALLIFGYAMLPIGLILWSPVPVIIGRVCELIAIALSDEE